MRLFYKLNENFVIWLLFDVVFFFLFFKEQRILGANDKFCEVILWFGHSGDMLWDFFKATSVHKAEQEDHTVSLILPGLKESENNLHLKFVR